MSKLVLKLLIILCFLSTASMASVDCPAGSTKTYSCSTMENDGTADMSTEVLAVCKVGNKTEYILEDGPLSVREEVISSQNPDSPECQDYIPVTSRPVINEIMLHSMSICLVENVSISYVWFGGTMPRIYLCQ